MYRVVFDKVKKDIKKLPIHIIKKLQRWAEQVELLGLPEVKRSYGWHDEPLKGQMTGQRSIRLNRAYRATYYAEKVDTDIKLIIVTRVHKHKY